MKLISMTDYVLEKAQEHFNNGEYPQFNYHDVTWNYARFLKQPLKLEMFVPCDKEGNVLEEPLEVLTISKGHLRNNKNYNKELNQYQKAKEKILFKDIPMNHIDIVVLKSYENKNKTIEDLFNETADVDFTLTENAIKQL